MSLRNGRGKSYCAQSYHESTTSLVIFFFFLERIEVGKHTNRLVNLLLLTKGCVNMGY